MVRRTKTIAFRTTEEERDKIVANAKNAHVAPGTYCRKKALEGDNAQQ